MSTQPTQSQALTSSQMKTPSVMPKLGASAVWIITNSDAPKLVTMMVESTCVIIAGQGGKSLRHTQVMTVLAIPGRNDQPIGPLQILLILLFKPLTRLIYFLMTSDKLNSNLLILTLMTPTIFFWLSSHLLSFKTYQRLMLGTLTTQQLCAHALLKVVSLSTTFFRSSIKTNKLVLFTLQLKLSNYLLKCQCMVSQIGGEQ